MKSAFDGSKAALAQAARRWNKATRGHGVVAALILVGLASGAGYAARIHLPATLIPLAEPALATLASQTVLTPGGTAPKGMLQAAENENFALFIHPDTAAVALLDQQSQKLWYTNPQQEAEGSSEVSLSRSRSQFKLEYYNAKNEINSMYSYPWSVKNQNFTVTPIDQGVRVEYQVGDFAYTREMLPGVVSKEDFEGLILSPLSEDSRSYLADKYTYMKLSDLSEVRRRKYLEAYPGLDQSKELYFYKTANADYETKKVYDLIFGGGLYTVAHMEEQMLELGLQPPKFSAEIFEISLEYRLLEDGLSVQVPCGELSVPEGCKLTSVALLEYFGAGGADEEGYLFLPDGSGTLIDFNNGKIEEQALSLRVYGDDLVGELDKPSVVKRQPVCLPVFGIHKQAGGGFLAEIRGAEERAFINADISGKESPYNRVYPQFIITDFQTIKVVSGDKTVKSNKYENKPYGGTLAVDYHFLPQEQSDYPEMARRFREILVQREQLAPKNEPPVFLTSLVGQLNGEQTTMGVTRRRDIPLTTTEQALEIVKELSTVGIRAPLVRYEGWFAGGVDNGLASRAQVPMSLGGASGMRKLGNAVEQSGGELLLGASVARVWDSWINFSSLTQGAHTLTGERAAVYPVDLARISFDKTKQPYHVLSSALIPAVCSRYGQAVADSGGDGVWLDDLGSRLFSDYDKQHPLDREAASGLALQATQGFADQAMAVGASAPNAYLLPEVSWASDVPLTDSGYRLTDRSVPFLQIVYSGLFPYTGPPVNYGGNPETELLRAVESGAGLQFRWMYAPDSYLKGIQSQQAEGMYSLNYQLWMPIAAAAYQRMNSELAELCTGEILDHQQVSEQVYQTVWEKGSVLVNYGQQNFVYQSTLVKAMDYTVVKGR